MQRGTSITRVHFSPNLDSCTALIVIADAISVDCMLVRISYWTWMLASTKHAMVGPVRSRW